MTTSKISDPIAEIMKREYEISNFIKNSNDSSVHYEYGINKSHDGLSIIDMAYIKIYTFNPKHTTSFLLFEDTRQISGSPLITKLSQLDDAIKYIQNVMSSNKIKSYTVKWSTKKDNKQIISYFVGIDMLDVVNKFYSGKNNNEYEIYEITLNPEA